MENTEERKISIGYDTPETLEKSVIYVTLTEEAPRGHPTVQLNSTEPFNYRNFSLEVDMVVKNCTNLVGDLYGYYRIPLSEVLETLVEKNKGQVEFREGVSPELVKSLF